MTFNIIYRSLGQTDGRTDSRTVGRSFGWSAQSCHSSSSTSPKKVNVYTCRHVYSMTLW